MIRTAQREDTPGGGGNGGAGRAATPTPVVPEAVHHEPARRKRGRAAAQARLNLTSMIDVIFQLLIYFVVTSTFALDEGILTTKMPVGTTGKQTTEVKPPPRTLYIEVSALGLDDTGYRLSVPELTAKPATFGELAELLAQAQFDPQRGLNGAFEPDNPVVIQPKGSVRWQHVVNAFNAAVQARYTNIAFAEVEGAT